MTFLSFIRAEIPGCCLCQFTYNDRMTAFQQLSSSSQLHQKYTATTMPTLPELCKFHPDKGLKDGTWLFLDLELS